MNKLTRAQVLATVKPGDVVLIHYLAKNAISAGIQWASGGTASHALCCLGGLEVVEADLGGIMHSFMDTYMTGKCRLTVKRLHPALDHREAAAAITFWRARVSDPYDFSMILRAGVVQPIRRTILKVCPPLGRLLLRMVGHLLPASHTLSTCAELWLRGMRVPRKTVLKAYDPEDVTPEVLLRDATGMETVVVWDAPVLAGKAA